MASTLFLAEQLDLKSIGPIADLEKSSENEVQSGIPCWTEDKPTYCNPPMLFQPSTQVFKFAQKSNGDFEEEASQLFFNDADPAEAPAIAGPRLSAVSSKVSRLSLFSEVREAADLELRIQRGFLPMRVLPVHADRMMDTLKELLEKLNFFRVLPQVISEISIDDSQVAISKEFEASLLQLLHVQATWQYIDDQTPQPTSKFLRRLMHFAQSKLDQGIPAPTAPLSLIPKSQHTELQDQKPPKDSPFPTPSKSATLPSDCYRADTTKAIADSLTDLKRLYDWDAETDALGAQMEHAVNKNLRSKILEVLGLSSSSSAPDVLHDLFGGAQDFLETPALKKKLRICHIQRDGTKCCEPYFKARRSHLRPNSTRQQNFAYAESEEGNQYACNVLDVVLDDVYKLGLDPYILRGHQKDPNSTNKCTAKGLNVQKRLDVLEHLALKKPEFFESLVAEAWNRAKCTENDRSFLLISAVKGKHGKELLKALNDEDLQGVLHHVQLHVDQYKELYAAQKCSKPDSRQKPTTPTTWRQKWLQHLGASADDDQNAGDSDWRLLRNNKTKQMILIKNYKDQQGNWRTRKIPLNDQGQPEILEERRMRKAGARLTNDDLSKLAQLKEEFGEDMPVVALKKYLWRARRAEMANADDDCDQELGAFDEFYETSDDSSEIPEDDTEFTLFRVQDASPPNAPTSKNTTSLAGFLGLPAEPQPTKIDLLTPTLNPGRWNHIEKLIAENRNLSQQHVERHLRGAYREAFRQAYNNRDKLSTYMQEHSEGARGTRAFKLFVGQFQVLLGLMQERMLVTPEEEVMKIHVLRQTWIREQRLLRLLESLKKKYLDLQSLRDMKIAKLNETISSLMTQIDTVYSHTRQELSMVISEYTKMELLTNKSADHSQQGLHGVLQRCVAAGSAFRAKYAEIEEDLQKQKRKHEAELEAVIAQYDTEMFDRQARLDKLVEDFKEQQTEVDKLEEELKKVERRTGQMEDEERKKQLKRRKRKKRKKGKGKKRSTKGKKSRSRSRRSKKRKRKGKKKRSKKSNKSETASDTEEEGTSNEETEDEEEEETDIEEEALETSPKPKKKSKKKKSKKKVSKKAKKSKSTKTPKIIKKSKKQNLESSSENVKPTSETEEEGENDQEETEAGGDAPSKKSPRRRRKGSMKRKKSKKSAKRSSEPAKPDAETGASSVTSTSSFVEPQKISGSAEVGSEASLKTSTTDTAPKANSEGTENSPKKLKKHSKKKSKKRSKSRKRSKKRKNKSRK